MAWQCGPLGRLVSFKGARGLRLDGILYQAPDAAVTVVHAHGSFGNFYQHCFVRSMSAAVQGAGVNLLSFNLSAHDGLAEGYFGSGGFEYVGASVVDFGTCLQDIAGAVDFARSVSERVVLSGHSLGCDRVVAASLHHGWKFPVILLAPCDSYALQSILRQPETVEAQLERLSAAGAARLPESTDDLLDWLPLLEYGVRSSLEWTYPNPITRRAFMSIATGEPYRLFRFDRDPDWSLLSRGLVVTPESDALLTTRVEVVGQFFRRAIPEGTHRVLPGDHLFSGFEHELAETVARWVVECGA